MKCCLGLLLLAAPLAAQTYLVAGDSRITLGQLLHDHPEGLVLTLPSATGQSLGAAFTALLAEAKLRLGKLQEADRMFKEAFARAPRPEIAREAADLARRCGADTLAEQWEVLAP